MYCVHIVPRAHAHMSARARSRHTVYSHSHSRAQRSCMIRHHVLLWYPSVHIYSSTYMLMRTIKYGASVPLFEQSRSLHRHSNKKKFRFALFASYHLSHHLIAKWATRNLCARTQNRGAINTITLLAITLEFPFMQTASCHTRNVCQNRNNSNSRNKSISCMNSEMLI